MRVRIAPGAVIAEIDHRQHAPRAPVQEPLQRDQQRRVGRSCSCSTAVRGGIRVVHADQSRSLHRARRHDIHSARSCGQSLATNLVARSDPDTSARPDWTRAAASSSSSLSGHCSSSFQQSSRCRLGAATDPNPRGRVTLRTIRRPGHGPSFDASRGNSVARQRLAIDLSGEDSLAGRFWWHRARRQRPLGPHRQQHCGSQHGSDQSHVEPRGFIVR